MKRQPTRRLEENAMILVGTSGFSYPDWRGTFYPKDLPAQDMLSYYAGHFPFVELNTTFYRLPEAGFLARMAARTPEDFSFVVKAFQDLTHRPHLLEPGALEGTFTAFRAALDELGGRLGAVLAQFPNSFRNNPRNQEYVAHWRRRMGDLPVVVEFRHRSWLTDEVERLLRRERLAFAAVDEPRLPGLLPPVAWSTASPAYVRFHGRNAARWYHHQASCERYDYLYSAEELGEWLPKLRRLDAETGKVLVAFNNHYQGQAPANARLLRSLLAG
ncbi:MAG: DUF72 domain-containing protein [Bacillota bacterium]|nr:DUF72 domain-containing protein [Bacillota bacterium]